MATAFEGEQKPQLIEDITTPNGMEYDVRQPNVRHQAIGKLQQQYLLSRPDFRAGDLSEHILGAGSTKTVPGYTRIPPLRLLRLPSHEELLRPLLASSRRKAAALAAAASAVWLKSANLNWFPKRYTLNRGVTKDLGTKTIKSLRLVAPLLLLLIALSWLLLAVLNPVPKPGPTARPRAKAANPTSQATLTSASTPETPAGSPGPSASGSAPQPLYSGSYVTPSAVTNLIGGQPVTTSPAAAPAPAPTATSTPPSTSQSGLPLPYTVSVPPVDVNAAGKPVISTSGTNVTLN